IIRQAVSLCLCVKLSRYTSTEDENREALDQMRDRAHRPANLVLLALSCLSFFLLLSSFAAPRAGAQRRRTPARPAPPPARAEFTHSRREHQLACDKCHQFPSPEWKDARKGDAAFPDVVRQPEHASCLS